MKTRIFVPMNTLIHGDAISGADIFVFELTKRLEETFEVHVITTDLGVKAWSRFAPSIKRLHLIRSFGTTQRHTFLPIIFLLRALAASNWVRKHISQSCVFYTPSDYLADIVPAAYMKLRWQHSIWISRIHHVISPPWRRVGNRFVNTLSFIGQRLSFLILLGSDLVLTLSGTYEELWRIGFRRLAILNPGVDLDAIKNTLPAQTKYDAIYVGRVHDTKGVFDLLEIWKKVVESRNNAKLAIVGGGSKHTIMAFQRQLAKYELQRNVEYLGFIPDARGVYGLIMSSKIYVNAEHENGWSMSGAEAMACGVPLIGYEKLKMFGVSFKKGFVTVPFRDFGKFAETIVSLLEDDKGRQALSKAAYDQARTFDWTLTSKSLEKIILELVRN